MHNIKRRVSAWNPLTRNHFSLESPRIKFFFERVFYVCSSFFFRISISVASNTSRGKTATVNMETVLFFWRNIWSSCDEWFSFLPLSTFAYINITTKATNNSYNSHLRHLKHMRKAKAFARNVSNALNQPFFIRSIEQQSINKCQLSAISRPVFRAMSPLLPSFCVRRVMHKICGFAITLHYCMYQSPRCANLWWKLIGKKLLTSTLNIL